MAALGPLMLAPARRRGRSGTSAGGGVGGGPGPPLPWPWAGSPPPCTAFLQFAGEGRDRKGAQPQAAERKRRTVGQAIPLAGIDEGEHGPRLVGGIGRASMETPHVLHHSSAKEPSQSSGGVSSTLITTSPTFRRTLSDGRTSMGSELNCEVWFGQRQRVVADHFLFGAAIPRAVTK